MGDFLGGGISAGSLGEGGGEKSRWLKLNRDDVEESGPRSWLLYEAARRRLSLGGATTTLGRVDDWPRSRRGGIMAAAECVGGRVSVDHVELNVRRVDAVIVGIRPGPE